MKGIDLHNVFHRDVHADIDKGAITALPPLVPDVAALLDGASVGELEELAADAALFAAHIHLRITRRVRAHLPAPPHERKP